MSDTSDLVLLARVAGSLVVVVLLALLAGRWARRNGARAGGEDLRVVQRLGLSREAGAVVVDVSGRRLLLGVTAHAVTLIADLAVGTPDVDGVRDVLRSAGGPVVLAARSGDAGDEVEGVAAEPDRPISVPDGAPFDRTPSLPSRRAVRVPAPRAAEPEPGPVERFPGPVEPASVDGSGRPEASSGAEPLAAQPLTRRAIRQAAARRRLAVPPSQRGTGSAVDPRTWAQALEALRDLTARRG